MALLLQERVRPFQFSEQSEILPHCFALRRSLKNKQNQDACDNSPQQREL